MAINFVLQLGGSPGSPEIKGDSIVKGHTSEIDILSWSWGMTQTGSTQIGAGGGGTGSADVHDLTLTKYIDSSTHLLNQYCHAGNHLEGAVLTCIKVGGKSGPVEYLKITMGSHDSKNGAVMISSTKTGQLEVVDGKQTDRILETITLNFNNVSIDHNPQEKTGSGGGTMSSGPLHIGSKG
jgi:type VI secretion system secreted protein Hcp